MEFPNIPTSSEASLSPTTKRALVFSVVFVVIIVGVISGALVYANNYTDKVLPGIVVENIPVGKLRREEVKNYFDGLDKKLSHEPIHITVNADGVPKQVAVSPDQGEHSIVRLDSDRIADYLLSFGKQGNIFLRTWQVFNSSIHMGLPSDMVIVYEEELIGALKKELAPFETKAKDAVLTVTSANPYAFEVSSSTVGMAFDYQTMVQDIKKQWISLEGPSLVVSPELSSPAITEDMVREVAEKGKDILDKGNIELRYRDEYSKRDLVWLVKPAEISSWLGVQKNEETAAMGLRREPVNAFLRKTVEPSVHREPKNALLTMDGEQIVTFQGSQTGVTLQYDDTYHAMNVVVMDRFFDTPATSTVTLVVTSVEPEITTGEVNDWGVEDVLGVGYSSYKGSPANRIKNIRFAVTKKLNGLLIKPGETFSMLNALKPFTEEAGYLPELVIKGDRIKPEVGGGLCQVGSTMFRAAMNSGLDIVERRNHSLVVNYYNDHRNKMPGADATIYDPAPDFKFKNDTDSNILIMTEMNEKTQELFFTLWGKSDGRKGQYLPPILHKWIPAGPTQEIITEELPAGQKKCQEPHPGAVASLTYERMMPNGEKVTRVFDSYYRPLPRICLVGGTPAAAPTPSSDPATAVPVIPAPGPADTAIPVE